MTRSGFRLVESMLLGKTDDLPRCEDAIIVTPDFVVVVDGATAPEACGCPHESPGRSAAQAITAATGRLAADVDLGEALRHWTAAVVAAAATHPGHAESLSASLAAYARQRREIWIVGDVSAALDGVVIQRTKVVDRVAAGFRRAVLHAEIASGASLDSLRSDDPGRAAILPLLRRQRAFRNVAASEYGFAAVAVEATPLALCQVVRLDARSHELVLATDGYPVVASDLATAEARVAAEISADPLMVGDHLQTKGVAPGAASFDDRAFVRPTIAPQAPDAR